MMCAMKIVVSIKECGEKNVDVLYYIVYGYGVAGFSNRHLWKAFVRSVDVENCPIWF